MTFSYDLLNAIAQLSAERLVDSLVIGAVLAAFAWVLLRLIPRQNSATRFAVWFSALLATAVVPWLNFVPPSTGSASRLAAAPYALLSLPAAWALCLFAAWLAIAAVVLARVALGLVQLRRLRWQCHPIDDNHSGLREVAARLCPSRPIEILVSDRLAVPTAIGFLKPAVILPAGLLEEMTTAELNQILLHELAHLRRWDDWTNLAQKFIKAMLFFHPAVWWVEQRISLEREMACDDAVLAETSSPRAYAQCLARLAEKSVLRRSAALAQAAVNRIRQTSLRVARILDGNRSQAVPVRKSALALLGAFACVCGLGIWQAPQLVAFTQAPPALASLESASPLERAMAGSIPPQAEERAENTTSKALPVTPKTDAARPKRAARRSRDARAPEASAGVLAKLNTTTTPSAEPGNEPSSADGRRQARASQVIEAKAAGHPVLTRGVVIVIVNDPVFGPTPIVWRFAIWQVRAPHGTSQADRTLPPKSI